jgi:hypothetical protein
VHYARWEGEADALTRAREIIADTPLPDDLTLGWITAETPDPIRAAVAEMALDCGVLPPSFAVLSGTIRPGTACFAMEPSGRVVSLAGAAAFLHPDHPDGRAECWWGMLATHPDRRGARLSLLLGAHAHGRHDGPLRLHPGLHRGRARQCRVRGRVRPSWFVPGRDIDPRRGRSYRADQRADDQVTCQAPYVNSPCRFAATGADRANDAHSCLCPAARPCRSSPVSVGGCGHSGAGPDGVVAGFLPGTVPWAGGDADLRDRDPVLHGGRDLGLRTRASGRQAGLFYALSVCRRSGRSSLPRARPVRRLLRSGGVRGASAHRLDGDARGPRAGLVDAVAAAVDHGRRAPAWSSDWGPRHERPTRKPLASMPRGPINTRQSTLRHPRRRR